ncbi:MAG: hypothetical protein SFV15_14710 [Polyangiaceae bacterium]|nr:hypothetical protein [Polyangiaceae bacterium]
MLTCLGASRILAQVSYFVYRVQFPCTECGEAVMLSGPQLVVECGACRSRLEIEAALWPSILGFRKFAAEFALVPGKTRGSSLTSGEFRFLVRWGPEVPQCAACGLALAAEAVPNGGVGALNCQCGASTQTFPVPAWLSALEPQALQVFGPEREGVAPSATVTTRDATRPVVFECPECGAKLKVKSDTARVHTCSYCDSDLYLPNALWRTLHPVRKRASFWVRFSD